MAVLDKFWDIVLLIRRQLLSQLSTSFVVGDES